MGTAEPQGHSLLPARDGGPGRCFFGNSNSSLLRPLLEGELDLGALGAGRAGGARAPTRGPLGVRWPVRPWAMDGSGRVSARVRGPYGVPLL